MELIVAIDISKFYYQFSVKLKVNFYNLPWLTMGCCYHIFISDKYTSAFVLRKQAEPGRLANQDLPWPLSKLRTFSADYFSRSWDQWSHAAFCYRNKYYVDCNNSRDESQLIIHIFVKDLNQSYMRFSEKVEKKSWVRVEMFGSFICRNFYKNFANLSTAHLRVRKSGAASVSATLLAVVFRLCSSKGIACVLLDVVVGFLVGFGRFVVIWGLFVVAFCDVFGLGFGVVILVGRVGFSDVDGFCEGRVGLFVVADGFFVVADDDGDDDADNDDDGLVVGLRVGLLVVVFPLVGLLVTVEDVVEVSAVPFRV